MLVRFGFVAMSVTLEKASPSKTVTLKTYQQLVERDLKVAREKVKRVARGNLINSLRLLRHCKVHGIEIYRFSSKIIPLATHPELSDWDYIEDLKEQLSEIGNFIKENKMRVTFHPDHYTLINSPKEEVFKSAIIDLTHHCRIFKAMGLDEHAKLITHVGGGYNNKEESLERFIENWARIPKDIARRMTLENDDKIFTANETLYLCEKLMLPMVLDIHHFKCNHEEESTLEEIYPRVISTWKYTGLPPKIHVSSPRNDTDFRSHNDYVKADDLYPFLMLARKYNVDLDVMVEAKQKDKAMFKLVQELGQLPDIEPINDASINIL